MFRWQSPLLSAWQLSGLLRWSIPVLLVYAGHTIWNGAMHFILLLMLAIVGAYVAILCEYRAALFPLFGSMLWLALRPQRLRDIAAVCFVFYPLLAVFLFTKDEVYYALERWVPDNFYLLAGSQSIENVLSLSGRSVFWKAGIDGLLAGNHLLVGTGHSALDARDYGVATSDGIYSTLIHKLSFHNALLDNLYIYGVTFGLFLLAIFTIGVWRLFILSRKNLMHFNYDAASFALFSLGMLALSNCHDGFFTSHNIFYLVIAAAFRCAVVPVRGSVACEESYPPRH